MNDRFKFRVWDKCKNEILSTQTFRIYQEPEFIYRSDDGYMYFSYDKDRYDIMQCTGLKDRNGKLIYEGDVLQENWHKYILEWANGAYVIKDIKRGTSYMFTSGMCIHKSEVIGNIYENKELLNE